MAINNNNLPRSPATAEFDEKLSKTYDKLLKEINRTLKTSMIEYKMNIDKILMPNEDEQQNKRVARLFIKKRLKILSSIDTLVRTMVAGRNKVSLFDMFGDDRMSMSKQYNNKFTKIKKLALQRLETGVSLIKFGDRTELPLSTIMFPTGNTKLYAVRYELLKQSMLTKVNRGIRNISFVAPTIKGRLKSRFGGVRNKARVPIMDFLVPTPNTNLYAMRYNFSKHVMLSKINKGINNLQFVAMSAVRTRTPEGDIIKTKLKPINTKVDVPISSFLIPSGNTWLYAARYEMMKWKLLTKIKKGINNLSFTGGKVDILEKFLPEESNNSEISAVISKALGKAVGRESRARASSIKRSAKANEFAVHKQQKRIDKQLKLDEERNKILTEAFLGGKGTTDMHRGADGIWTSKAAGKTTIIDRALGLAAGQGIVGLFKNKQSLDVMKTAMGTLAKTAGKTLGVVGAGALGYQLGRYIDNKLGISTGVAAAAGAVTTALGNKSYVEDVVTPGLGAADVKSKYYDLAGHGGQSNAQKAKLFQQATQDAKRRMENRRSQFSAAGVDYTTEDLRSLRPVEHIILEKQSKSLPAWNPNAPGLYDSTVGNFGYQGNAGANAINFSALNNSIQKMTEAATKSTKQGTTIINPHPSFDFNIPGNLDQWMDY